MNHIYTRLINREHPLPKDYVPDNLVDIGLPFDAPPHDPKRLLEEKTALAAMELISRSRREGLNLCCISGYRSYQRQKELFAVSSYTAPPGASEHQSGLALDVSCPQIRMELKEAFAETAEGLWLARHAPLYGFILRYPAGKESITQIPYEPWHIRYVTKPLAAYLSLTGMTLEEYDILQKENSRSGKYSSPYI